MFHLLRSFEPPNWRNTHSLQRSPRHPISYAFHPYLALLTKCHGWVCHGASPKPLGFLPSANAISMTLRLTVRSPSGVAVRGHRPLDGFLHRSMQLQSELPFIPPIVFQGRIAAAAHACRCHLLIALPTPSARDRQLATLYIRCRTWLMDFKTLPTRQPYQGFVPARTSTRTLQIHTFFATSPTLTPMQVNRRLLLGHSMMPASGAISLDKASTATDSKLRPRYRSVTITAPLWISHDHSRPSTAKQVHRPRQIQPILFQHLLTQ